MYMNRKPRSISVSILFLLFFVSIGVNAEIYPYIGISFGVSAADEECEEDAPYYDPQCDGDSSAQKIFGGVRLNKNIALEISYLDMGRLEKSRNTGWVAAEPTGTNFSLIGVIPSDFMEVFAKVGLMYWDATLSGSEIAGGSIEDNGADISLGIGFSFGNEKYALRAEFEMLNELGDEYKSGGARITLLSIGGVIYF